VLELLPGSIRRQTDLIETGVRDRQPADRNTKEREGNYFLFIRILIYLDIFSLKFI